MTSSNNNDDKDRSLYELSVRHQASIVSQLVDIGSDHYQLQHVKFLPIIKSLQCLQSDGLRLRRTSINAFAQRDYLALSYTWTCSEEEGSESGRYSVEDWDTHNLNPSEVRNSVFDRVLGYMCYANVRYLWIDRHCIRQDTCRATACTHHDSCIQKRDALQAMDLVYHLSNHPVALLGRPLRDQFELLLLEQILSGHFVNKSSLRRPRGTIMTAAKKALKLLHDITQDMWWTRAWTFQENYRGGEQMQLLIAHDSSLEQQKQRLKIFGRVPGEVCVHSATFSKEATRLCLALRRAAPRPSADEAGCINEVLSAAGRYTLMLPESSAMTPTIITDVESRGLMNPWDRLPILANCCQYSLRLDGEALRQKRHSLSLSTLAMCLLNGEILNNNSGGLEPPTSLTSLKTSDFLKRYLFEAFSAPMDESRRLTFYKGCRLTDVDITADGISTSGHIWKLGHIIDTSEFGPLPWIDEPNGRLGLLRRRRLLQLINYLDHRRRRYSTLAEDIDHYLAADAVAGDGEPKSFTEMYLYCMASEVANAIDMEQKLILGTIWHPEGRYSPYRAVFVWSDDQDCETVPEFVFTSAWPGNPGSDTHDSNDIDRHVSLEVDLEGVMDDDVPLLRTRTWMLGLCFFNGCEAMDVVFPWPRALQDIKP